MEQTPDQKTRDSPSERILRMRRETLDYTDDQREALLNISRFIGEYGNDFFLLEGYAGTGKTTMVENIGKEASQQGRGVIVLAPTNRAIKTLRAKLGGDIFELATIHRAIYGEPDRETGEFEVSEDTLINRSDVVIVDEASMIPGNFDEDGTVAGDLMRCLEEDNKVIFIGDEFQLEPVGEDPGLFDWSHKTFREKNHSLLAQVVRQSSSALLEYATWLRSERELAVPAESNDNVRVTSDTTKFKNRYLEELTAGEDLIYITATNMERVSVNYMAREALGISDQPVTSDEQLIAIGNTELAANGEAITLRQMSNSEGFIMPGEKGTEIHEITYPMYDWSDDEYEYVDLILLTKNTLFGGKKGLFLFPDTQQSTIAPQQMSYAYYDHIENSKLERKWGHQDVVDDFIFYNPKSRRHQMDLSRIIIATYGAAITAHKSQGGEWSHVYVDQNFAFGSNPARWMYTAATRAQNKLMLRESSHHSLAEWGEIKQVAEQHKSEL